MVSTGNAFKDLAGYYSRPIDKTTLPGPSSADVARYILLNATPPGKFKLPKSVPGGESEGPSLMGRIFDVLSRPNYAIAEFAREWIETGDPNLTPLWEGISGKKKTTFSDALVQAGMPESNLNTAALGLGLDLALDPTTYIGAGAISKVGRAAGLRKKEPKLSSAPMDDKNLGQRLLDQGEPIHPESFGLPEKLNQAMPTALRGATPPLSFPRNALALGKGFKLKQPMLPGFPQKMAAPLTKEAVPPPVGASKEIPGQLAFNLSSRKKSSIWHKGGVEAVRKAVAESAPDIVSGVTKGDIDAVVKIAPVPGPKVTPKQTQLAQDIAARFDDTKFADKRFPESLGPQQQAMLWQSAKKASKGDLDQTIKVYSAVENLFKTAGKVPRSSSGENVGLSDVISNLVAEGSPVGDRVVREFTKGPTEGSDVWNAVEKIRATSAIGESGKVQEIVSKIAESSGVAKATASNAQMKEFESFFKKFGQATARAAEVSPAGIRATKGLVGLALNAGKSKADIAIQGMAKELDEVVAKGKNNPRINEVTVRELERDLGKLPKWATSDNKAVEFIMGRVATWYGQSDLRPFTLNSMGSAMSTAAARGEALEKLFKPFNSVQRHEALKLAQGYGITSARPEITHLAGQIKALMDNMTGTMSGTSIVLKAGLNMDIVNKWLRRYNTGFEYTNGTVTTVTGRLKDYSKGTDWLDSWKTADIKDDPQMFLFRYQEAIEMSVRERALFDDMAARFGAKAPGKGYRNKIEGHPYLEGYYFPDDIAKQIPRMIKDWTNTASWNTKNPLLRHYDRVLSMWKAGVTIYRPAHHIRNMSGDVYLAWMDGVNSVKPYMLAARVQRSMGDSYEDLADIDKLVELGVMSKNLRTPQANEVLFTNKSGVKFTSEQIHAVAHEKGLLEVAKTIEDIIDLGSSGKGSILDKKILGGRVQKIARSASELQQHNVRLAHFIDKVSKSRGSNLEEIFELAARRARKWHPTGLDLTDFERTVMRRIIPFYSWMRKSTPLLLEGLVMNPGKTVVPSKIYGAIQEAQGIETPGRDDPFPIDQMFPEWIKSQGIGPVGLPDSGFLGALSNQMPPGYTMAGVGLNPLQDLIASLEDPGRTIGSAITPAAKIPIETVMTGRKLFTGEPITGSEAAPGAMSQYVGEQIPIWSALQGITGITPFGTETKKSINSGNQAGFESFINWLTSAGIRGTGPYQKQAFFEKQAPLRQMRREAKNEALRRSN